jgi:hypothetical protein
MRSSFCSPLLLAQSYPACIGAASLLKDPCSECNSSCIQYQLRLLSCSSPLSRGLGGCTVLSGAVLRRSDSRGRK